MFSGAFVVIDWIGDLDSEYRGYTAIFIFILMLFSTISNNIFKLFSRLIIPFAGVLLAIVIVLYVFFALEWI
ncbi:MAG: hypothetical protein H8E55_00115 [Pelagibacterales bacterium]|nr:hypothetical protein [Pelagibacterales bacterium]